MDGHPGGAEHSRYLIELAFLPRGSRWLDMGAGDGSALRILEEQGHTALGIDLEPRGPEVEKGDFLRCPYPSGSAAWKEAARLLRKGGKLVFSDVTEDVTELLKQVRLAGFAVRHMDDFSRQWREYYLEALWREEEPCRIRMKKCSYVLFACERM